jgi:hypothetical protein
MAGHVFVVRGDLFNFACDAFAVSGNDDGAPSAIFRPQLVGRYRLEPDGNGCLEPVGRERGPVAFVVPAAGSESDSPTKFMRQLEISLRKAAKKLPAKPAHDRPCPLIALPPIGTRKGGQVRRKRELLERYFRDLPKLLDELKLDVAFLMANPVTYDQGQVLRREMGASLWRELPEAICGACDELANRTLAGELAVFMGAGVGMAAGLPGWQDLLVEVARRHGIAMGSVDGTPLLDVASWMERKLQPPLPSLEEAVAQVIIDHRHPSLTHALLACLPAETFVTTNYDQLFERSAEMAGRPVRVLPYDEPGRARRVLFKMHGCVDEKNEIVLTRESFQRYDKDRSALAGALAGLAMTKHLLFVGSSMKDDNILRIIDEVRVLFGAGNPKRAGTHLIGTNLSVGDNAFLREAWEKEIEWAVCGDGRKMQIALDRIVCLAHSDLSHLFGVEDGNQLTDEERALGEALLKVRDVLPRENTAVRGRLERLLSEIGVPTPEHREERGGRRDAPSGCLRRGRR